MIAASLSVTQKITRIEASTGNNPAPHKERKQKNRLCNDKMNCSIASLFALIALLSNAGAWIARPSSLARNTRKISLMTRCAAAENEIEMDGNPCWEDIYDDDCTMSNVFGASFVAADWIKTMPCAQGIEVCTTRQTTKQSREPCAPLTLAQPPFSRSACAPTRIATCRTT